MSTDDQEPSQTTPAGDMESFPAPPIDDPLNPSGAVAAEIGDDGPGGGLERRAVRSFGWAAISLGSNRLVVFVTTLVLARLLTPEDFGIVAAATVMLTYLEAGLDVGVGAALIHDQEHGVTRRVQIAFTLNVAVALVLTSALLVLAPVVARFFGVSEDVGIFRAMSLFLLLRGLGQVQNAVMRRDLDFKRRTVVDVSRAVVRLAVSVPLAVAGAGAWALVWGLLAGEAVGTALSWWIVRFLPRFEFAWSEARSLMSFGLKTMGVKLLNVFAVNADYIAVGGRLGAEQLGFYSVAFRLPDLLLGNVYYIFSSVAFPAYSKARARSMESLRSAMLRALSLTTLFGFSVGVGLAITSRDLIYVLFGAKWLPSAEPMALLALAAGVAAVGFASGDIFPAIGRPGYLLRINIVFAPLLAAGVVAGTFWGLVAVAAAHLVTHFGYAAARLAIANRLIGTNLGQCMTAMRPGIVAAAGIALAGLPVRLATDAGLAGLVLTVGAGAVGGLLAVTLFARSTFSDVVSLLRRSLRSRHG